MLAFWINPDSNPAATRAAGPAGSWEVVARSFLPSGRRVVRPLAGAFIMVGAAQGPAVMGAHWGCHRGRKEKPGGLLRSGGLGCRRND